MNTTNLNPSTQPLEVLEKLHYTGQPLKMIQYRSGYETFMSRMPRLKDDSPTLKMDVERTKVIMQELSAKIASDGWVELNMPRENRFDRVILAIDDREKFAITSEVVICEKSEDSLIKHCGIKYFFEQINS